MCPIALDWEFAYVNANLTTLSYEGREEKELETVGTALEGTIAVETSGHGAGPYAGSLLGDLGCEVIKVGLPGGYDKEAIQGLRARGLI